MYEAQAAPRFVQAVAGGEHTLFLSDRGAVFVCGRSDNGRLGLAMSTWLTDQLNSFGALHGMDVTVPVEVPLPPCVMVAAGEYHSAAVHTAPHDEGARTAPFRFSTFGSGAVGQLGHGSNVEDVAEPREVEYFAQLMSGTTPGTEGPVRSVAMGDGHTIVVLADASSHAFGNNESGALGITTSMSSGFSKHSERYGFGARGPSRATASQVTPLAQHDVKTATTCSRHTLFLINTGELFVCGDNSFGQLGLKGLPKSSIPRRVASLDVGVVQAACGARHSLVLCQDGTVRGCGSNRTGELGLGEAIDQVDTFTTIPLRCRVSSIAAGAAHSLFTSADGRLVFGCGWGSCGLLGVNSTEDVWDPNTVVFSTEQTAGAPAEVTVASVSCGSHHTLILLSDGRVWCAGCNGHGQLGVGSIEAKCLQWRLVENSLAITQNDRLAAIEESVQRRRAAPPQIGDAFQPRLHAVEAPETPCTPTETNSTMQDDDKFVCFSRSCLSPT